MEIAEFKYFKKLIIEVWKKAHPSVLFEKPIQEYDGKLLEIEVDIEERAVNRIFKNSPPITKRSLRDYTNAVLDNYPEAINPTQKTKDILSRYVLNAEKLKDTALIDWHKNKDYKRNKFWNEFKDQNLVQTTPKLLVKNNLLSKPSRFFNKIPKSFSLGIGLIAIICFVIYGFLHLETSAKVTALTKNLVLNHEHIKYHEFHMTSDLTQWIDRSTRVYSDKPPLTPWWQDEIATGINKLVISRTSKNANKIVMCISTGGDTPIITGLTHPFKILEYKRGFFYDPKINSEWFVEFDISKAPLNYPFVILYNVVYKNGYQGSRQFTGIDSDKNWEMVFMKVKFPNNKKYASAIDLLEIPKTDNAKYLPYKGEIDTFSRANKSVFHWNLKNPKTDHIYRLQWDW